MAPVPDQRPPIDPPCLQREDAAFLDLPFTWDPDAVDSGTVYRRVTRQVRESRRRRRVPEPAKPVTGNILLTLIALGSGPR